MSAPYDASFFAAQAVSSMKSARAILPELFSRLQPNSVLDVGCGIGPWLRAAGDLGARVLLGVDGEYVEQRLLMIPSESFVPVDLARPGLKEKVVAIHPGRFDLVICLEVAEHLPFERSASLVEELCQLGDVVLFSAAIPFQGGTQHINEQWPEFWALLFRSFGFVCYDWLRQQIWAVPNVDWWYAQNVLLFVRESSPVRADLPANAVVEREALSRVHPHSWLSALLTKVVVHRESAWRDEPEDLNSVIRAYTQGERLTPVLRAVEGARLAEPGARDVFPWTRLDNIPLTDVGRLDAENKILNAEKRSLDAELQRLRADNQSLDAELWHLRADNQSLDADLERLRGDNQSLDADLERLRGDNQFLDADLERLRGDNQSLDADLERLRGDNQSLDADLERLRGDNQSLDAELQRLNRERKDSTVELYRVDAERERLLVDLAALSEQLAPLKQALSESTGEIDTLREVLAAREDELVTHKRALSESAGEIDTLREVLTAREDELVTLKQALSESSGEIDTQRRALANYGAKVDEMRATISTLEASTSWRITRPMRAAKHLLGQLRYSVIGYVLTVSFRALRRRSLVPLRHWRDARVIARSGLFDRRWYFENNPDVAAWRINPIHHYIEHGAAEGRNPNLFFDTRTYLSFNPDVGAAGVNPFAHYLLYAAAEKRQPYCSAEDRTERSENTSSLGFSTLVGKSLLQVASPVWRRLPLSAIHKQRLASIAYTVAGPLFEGFAGYDAWRANSARPLKRVAPEPATLATRCPEDHIEGLELSSDDHPLVSHPIRRRHT
jgi:hypothetical protein